MPYCLLLLQQSCVIQICYTVEYLIELSVMAFSGQIIRITALAHVWISAHVVNLSQVDLQIIYDVNSYCIVAVFALLG